jgi:hypothetical protein
LKIARERRHILWSRAAIQIIKEGIWRLLKEAVAGNAEQEYLIVVELSEA